MHIKFCCLQLRPGKEKLSYLLKCFYCIFSYNIPTIPSVSSRFKSLLQNRPAAENTCIEISHVKYNIFHVRTSSCSHLSSFAFPITATNPETTVTMSKVTTQSCKTKLKFVVFSYNCSQHHISEAVMIMKLQNISRFIHKLSHDKHTY